MKHQSPGCCVHVHVRICAYVEAASPSVRRRDRCRQYYASSLYRLSTKGRHHCRHRRLLRQTPGSSSNALAPTKPHPSNGSISLETLTIFMQGRYEAAEEIKLINKTIKYAPAMANNLLNYLFKNSLSLNGRVNRVIKRRCALTAAVPTSLHSIYTRASHNK